MNAYLMFNGNCEEAFNFYKEVFGGEFTDLNRYKEMPPSEEFQISEADGEKIMHVTYALKEGIVLMASDSLSQFGEVVEGSNFSLSMDTDSKAEADTIFQKLSVGGQITRPLEETFWNAYFGSFTDKFGIQWMINHDLK